MRPSRNDIVASARAFATEWQNETSEKAEAQTFWTEFLAIFGIHRRRAHAAFERHARRSSTQGGGFIDLIWPGMILAEHKSAGEDLEAATGQALDYLESLPDADLPRLILVSDFARIGVLDLDSSERKLFVFPLSQLADEIDRLLFLAGYTTRSFEVEGAVNVQAAELLGKVYDEIAASGYHGHPLRVLIVRLLFLMFGDDTGLWARSQFRDLLLNRTSEDGADLGMWLGKLFGVLDTPEERRTTALDRDLAAFPYVNGGLFTERHEPPDTTRQMRHRLLEACRFDWSKISPAIFGSMFQSVMDPVARRALGAHYTSEENILRVIRPLFVDELEADLAECGSSRQRLSALHEKLGRLTFFDPACGCGNFLVVAYRELCRLEREVLAKLYPGNVQMGFSLEGHRRVRVDQFHGIEIEEFPARIAETAMYLVEHLENEELSRSFGLNVVDLPLTATADIRIGNALRIDWADVLSPERCSYLYGNPPFVGKKARSPEQQADMTSVFGGAPGTATLDYVAAWYEKARKYLRGTGARAAFVSTNSITQGEQVPALWPRLLDDRFDIGFAHRTFEWTSEAKGMAHVHCVIVGFCQGAWRGKRWIFDYSTPRSEPHQLQVSHINPYLVEAPTVYVYKRREPLVPVQRASFGSMPNDEGNFILDDDEAAHLRPADLVAARFLREMASTRQLLHGERRWCLWLEGATAADVHSSRELARRVEAVRAYRAKSERATTRALAQTPHLFGEMRQPTSPYLCIPRHVSELRAIVPMRFFGPEVIASDSTLVVPGADLFLFGVLQSAMFTAWVRAVGGRIKSDLRMSVETVYNTFPFPDPSDPNRARVVTAAHEVMIARDAHPGQPLSALYDPLATPPDIIRAHHHLDLAVDACFGRRGTLGEAERLALLFDRYVQLSAALELDRRPRTKAAASAGASAR